MSKKDPYPLWLVRKSAHHRLAKTLAHVGVLHQHAPKNQSSYSKLPVKNTGKGKKNYRMIKFNWVVKASLYQSLLVKNTSTCKGCS